MEPISSIAYISGDLAEWLEGKDMDHVRGAPYHPQMLDSHDGPFDAENIEPDAIKAWMSRLANRRKKK